MLGRQGCKPAEVLLMPMDKEWHREYARRRRLVGAVCQGCGLSPASKRLDRCTHRPLKLCEICYEALDLVRSVHLNAGDAGLKALGRLLADMGRITKP